MTTLWTGQYFLVAGEGGAHLCRLGHTYAGQGQGSSLSTGSSFSVLAAALHVGSGGCVPSRSHGLLVSVPPISFPSKVFSCVSFQQYAVLYWFSKLYNVPCLNR